MFRMFASTSQHTDFFNRMGGKLMGWMAPASTGVAMRHNAGV